MYQSQKEILVDGKSHKFILYEQDEQLRYRDFIILLQDDEEFRSFFINLLSDISFHAYHWETPPVTSDSTDQLFEFVISNSPGIDLAPDPGPFRQYFDDTNEGYEIVVFNNLGNDAKLIAPTPKGGRYNYSHIGVFTESAPMEQQKVLWQTVGQVTEELISDQQLWLNTAGGGVAWLHVRLDSRPKYYRHRPYISPSKANY